MNALPALELSKHCSKELSVTPMYALPAVELWGEYYTAVAGLDVRAACTGAVEKGCIAAALVRDMRAARIGAIETIR